MAVCLYLTFPGGDDKTLGILTASSFSFLFLAVLPYVYILDLCDGVSPYKYNIVNVIDKLSSTMRIWIYFSRRGILEK
jgi:hypothetical protein